MANNILGYGASFPASPPDNFMFTRTDLLGNPVFVYDDENTVWQQVANPSQEN